MRYAKLIDNALQYAPNPIRANGRDIFTTDPRPYGYKPVVYTEPPEEEGMIAVFDGWEETPELIRELWRLEPAPEPPAMPEDYEAALAKLGVETRDAEGGVPYEEEIT